MASYPLPANVLDRLEEIGVLTPIAQGYDPDDMAIIAAIARFRAGGYEEALGFTVYDTLRYREALQPLVEEEVAVLLGRLAGQVDVERAVQIIASGTEPLRELVGADALQAAARGPAAGPSPPGVVMLHDPEPARELDAAWQRAGERAHRLAVVAAQPAEVRMARERGLGREAQGVDGAQIGVKVARRRPRSATPSTQIVRSESRGGSLTPLTRFQATSCPASERPTPADQYQLVWRS